MPKILLVIFILYFFPVSVLAAVEISEIAWMGSIQSANHEWIELYNDGGAVDVTGWTISDGNNLSIDLVGTLAANSYAVLERTSDNSAVGTAFLIYTGALGNSGATLTLRDETNSVVDQVIGGADWQNIGGNNETKETAQKKDSGWLTGLATPGNGTASVVLSNIEPDNSETSNNTAVSNNVESNTKTTSAKITKKSSGEATVLKLPDVTLQLDITAPSFVYVNQPVEFLVTPSGVGDTLADSLQYVWNFGDSSTGVGKTAKHTFRYPGTYVVVADGQYKRQRQVARTQIVVLPVELSVEVAANGDVTILNQGEKEIDLSSYRLVGRETFVFPKHSILLSGQTVTVPGQKIKTDTTVVTVILYDQENKLISKDLPTEAELEITHKLTQHKQQTLLIDPVPQISALSKHRMIDNSPTKNIEKFNFASSKVLDTPSVVPVAFAGGLGSTSQVAEVAQAAWKLPAEWPLYTLVIILLLGILSMYLIPSQQRGEE